jgi:hypothetical protein
MVKGLEVFREHFRDYADRYVFIGGAACDIAMTGAGLAFRATKDLDIVLFVEALDAAFVRAFWEFVRIGGYEVQEKSTGEKQFYRFQKPTNANYPFMLELFSRQPDVLQVADGSHLTPLPVEEDASSLSAILLDNDYRHCRSRRSSGDSAWGLAECFRAPPRALPAPLRLQPTVGSWRSVESNTRSPARPPIWGNCTCGRSGRERICSRPNGGKRRKAAWGSPLQR